MDASHDRIATEARPSLRERARQAIEDGNTSDDAERLRLLEELHGELEGELGEASPRR